MTTQNLVESIINTVTKLDLKEDEINAYLDYRDSAPFDTQWVESFNELENQNYSKTLLKQITENQEKVFKGVYKATYSSELASYLSDDVEFIIKAEFVNSQNIFVKKLIQHYLAEKLPK